MLVGSKSPTTGRSCSTGGPYINIDDQTTGDQEQLKLHGQQGLGDKGISLTWTPPNQGPSVVEVSAVSFRRGQVVVWLITDRPLAETVTHGRLIDQRLRHRPP